MSAVYEIEFIDHLPPAPPKRRVVTDPNHVAPDSHRAHGTRVKYVVERCRCQPCREASTEAERARQRALRRGQWHPYVPAGRAREHLRDLMAGGVGPKTVAKLSGVPHGTISKIIYGDYVRKMAPSKRIRRETQNKILAVTIRDANGGQKIPAGPTWRLLDELIALGYTKSWIASELAGKPTPALQIRRDLVRASTARKVEELHARVGGRKGPGRRNPWDARRKAVA